jgi:kojibiose phosphorylase
MTSPWLVVEDGFDPALATRYETLFTVGNGYLGTRGALEEGH